MTRTVFVALLLFTCSSGNNVFGASKPNFVFLFADDQRADTIGAHGNPHIHTPHLDQLSSEGFSFRRNYCAGSFSGAVCVASRAMLMTGRHWMRIPTKNRSRDWADLPLLPSTLTREGGYRSFIVGKWHNGEDTLHRAFTSGRAVYMGGMANHASFVVRDLVDGELTPKRDADGFSTTVYANEAIDFIEGADAEEPFFLYVSLTAPHDPRNPPESYRKRYYENRPPLPPNFLPLHPFKNAPQATSGRDESLAPWPRTKEVISDQLCEYYGLITHLDEQVGRVLQALENTPHAENTYVVYTADHGLGMGSHGLLGKQNLYEQSMRCPLIIRGPGIPAGKSTEAFTYIHDLHATLLTLAGVPTPEGIDATDLAPLWQGEADSLHHSLFLPFQDNQRTINDGRWKLHIYPKINHRLLFDLQSDPHEIHDLAQAPENVPTVNRLVRLMQSWRTRLNDPNPLRSANPEPKEVHYDNATRTRDRWQPQWIRDKYFNSGEEASPRR